MNFAPKVGPLVAELLSGVISLLIIYFGFHGFSLDQIDKLTGGAIAVLVLLAWILGTFFDLIRNLLEWVWDSQYLANHPLNWTFFFRGDKDRLSNLEHYFWSFYLLDADVAIAILISVILSPCILLIAGRIIIGLKWGAWIVLLLIALLFANDARLLRREIKTFLDAEPN